MILTILLLFKDSTTTTAANHKPDRERVGRVVAAS